MVGDSLFNDIFGANQFEIDSLLITSGIHRKDFSSNSDFQGIIDNINNTF